ncbi:hypothetical protein NQ318_017667 [Aromia moschata]|uniref:Uncharacterized protein n=1 Tax=Aromia moschata TaxID=1265417 RepID=A0AAV8X1Q7_9CUCU|nr:hypothetical protein NQ318_017667 [Aromia moschata]
MKNIKINQMMMLKIITTLNLKTMNKRKGRDYRSYETKLDSSEKRSNHNKERYETKSKSSYKNKNRARSDDSDSERERNNRKKEKT